MSNDAKPASAENGANPFIINPAIVRTVDGEKWAGDNVEERERMLRIVNYETTDCETVAEVVDVPYHRVLGVQRYPLTDQLAEAMESVEDRAPLTADGGTDDLEGRVTELERKVENIAAHNRRDTAPEGRR
ncbi:hypothetical protein JCM30237_12120 [Halolamina litorea]|uniref:Uncharacterized protein n=1 Tax=Halolamina litorea TaxID=1515593 RepID=A0ABD6BML3_9EURY|nr:hypothetical protein [Halolamina litorea]